MEKLQNLFNLLGVASLYQILIAGRTRCFHCRQQLLKLPINFFPFTFFSNIQQGLQTLGELQKDTFVARVGGQDSASLPFQFLAMRRLFHLAILEPHEWRPRLYGCLREPGAIPCNRKVP